LANLAALTRSRAGCIHACFVSANVSCAVRNGGRRGEEVSVGRRACRPPPDKRARVHARILCIFLFSDTLLGVYRFLGLH